MLVVIINAIFFVCLIGQQPSDTWHTWLANPLFSGQRQELVYDSCYTSEHNIEEKAERKSQAQAFPKEALNVWNTYIPAPPLKAFLCLQQFSRPPPVVLKN